MDLFSVPERQLHHVAASMGFASLAGLMGSSDEGNGVPGVPPMQVNMFIGSGEGGEDGIMFILCRGCVLQWRVL